MASPRLIGALPRPDLVAYLDVSPKRAHERIVARGTDEESLADLQSLRDAYRSLPEYTDFVKIDADATPAAVLSGLAEATDDTGGLKV
ncbi:hypothetical protein ABFP37_16010 [Burkholderia sp. RS01]|uniref:hypothetical protein n=1 Tax=unclassified Burkholderia TaxID=2613784 RepID=UPI0026890275